MNLGVSRKQLPFTSSIQAMDLPVGAWNRRLFTACSLLQVPLYLQTAFLEQRPKTVNEEMC